MWPFIINTTFDFTSYFSFMTKHNIQHSERRERPGDYRT